MHDKLTITVERLRSPENLSTEFRVYTSESSRCPERFVLDESVVSSAPVDPDTLQAIIIGRLVQNLLTSGKSLQRIAQ